MNLAILDTFLINLAKVHRDKLNGRDVIVAPVTLIVPGVLPGSNGPLFYPPEEVAASASAWNRVPLTLGHPLRNGQPVLAKELDKDRTLGEVQNARYEVSEYDPVGKLVGRAWFDVDRTRKLAPAILNALERGDKLEVSTGLLLHMVPAPDGAQYNGRPYTHVTKNYRPDHLAILVSEPGACSVNDGCGVNNANSVTLNCHCDKCNADVMDWLLAKSNESKQNGVPQCTGPVPTSTKGATMFDFHINRDPNTGMLLPVDSRPVMNTMLIPTANAVRAGKGVGLPTARIQFANPLAKLGKGLIANSDNQHTETRIVSGD